MQFVSFFHDPFFPWQLCHFPFPAMSSSVAQLMHLTHYCFPVLLALRHLSTFLLTTRNLLFYNKEEREAFSDSSKIYNAVKSYISEWLPFRGFSTLCLSFYEKEIITSFSIFLSFTTDY